MTTRTIEAECASGDGATMSISTAGQGVDTVLTFKIGDQTVWVDRFDLGDLIGFLTVERRRHEAEWPIEDEDEDDVLAEVQP